MEANLPDRHSALTSAPRKNALMQSSVSLSRRAASRIPICCRVLCPATMLALVALSVPARSQTQSQQSSESIAEAARHAREQKSNSTKQVRVITNDDLPELVPAPQPGGVASASASSASSSALAVSPTGIVATPMAPGSASCHDSAAAQALTTELQDTQQQRDQIHDQLSAQAPVISGGDLDMTNFKPGASGLNVGAPPHDESQPLAPGRITEVRLDERIAALKKNLEIACDSPEEAAIQRQLDALDAQLKLLQRQFALDQEAYYSKTDYASDIAGKANLNGEQQQIESLQSDKDRLSSELAALKAKEAPPGE